MCAKYFAGEASQIKEYNIAVEALGCAPDFDPKRDSIVRVEAYRLRKRLSQYYEKDGRRHAVRIAIPPGQYVPQFLEQGGPKHDEQPAPTAGDPAPAPPADMPRAGRDWRGILAAVLLIAAAAGAAGFLLSRSSARTIKASGPPVFGTAPEGQEIRILAGAAGERYVDRAGNVWSGDRDFQGGSAFATPGHPIAGTVTM